MRRPWCRIPRAPSRTPSRPAWRRGARVCRTPGARAAALASLALATAGCGDEAPTDPDPDEAPPGIVFDLLVDGNRDIYRVGLDGTGLTRLTTDPGDDRDPTTDGARVVFTSYRDGNAELYAVALDGGTAERLTVTDDDETDPALSPDGDRLAFISDEGGVDKLWLADADAADRRRLTEGFGHGGSIEASPSWAPDSDRLAYLSTEDGSADLFTITPTGERTPLAPGEAAEVEPAWSPDGESVAFASNRDGGTDLYRVEIVSGEVRRLTERGGTDGQPTWTSDGRVVYTAWIDGEPALRWLDPAAPDDVEGIDVGAGTPSHPSGIR